MKTKYRHFEYSTHRFNPNIIAVSLVAVEEIAKAAENYDVWRIVTYRDVSGKGFWTSQDQTKVRRGMHWGEGGEKRIHATDLTNALRNHAKAVQFQQERVKNPAYKVADVLHPTKAEDWNKEEAEKYSSASRGRF